MLADEALQGYIARTGSDCEDSLAALLADLMHWSDKCDLSFPAELQRARYIFLARIIEERDA
jgi:hypothetical protein